MMHLEFNLEKELQEFISSNYDNPQSFRKTLEDDDGKKDSFEEIIGFILEANHNEKNAYKNKDKKIFPRIDCAESKYHFSVLADKYLQMPWMQSKKCTSHLVETLIASELLPLRREELDPKRTLIESGGRALVNIIYKYDFQEDITGKFDFFKLIRHLTKNFVQWVYYFVLVYIIVAAYQYGWVSFSLFTIIWLTTSIIDSYLNNHYNFKTAEKVFNKICGTTNYHATKLTYIHNEIVSCHYDVNTIIKRLQTLERKGLVIPSLTYPLLKLHA